MMADAGYNPIEMARFFEKLEGKEGGGGAIEQFLSDHPNPGNRVEAISEEVRELPRRAYVDDETGQFFQIRDVVRHLAAPAKAQAAGAVAPVESPSKESETYEARLYSLRYPSNWRVHRGDGENAVTIGPAGGVLAGAVGYGIEVNYFAGDSKALMDHLEQANADMHVVQEPRNIEIAGRPAVLSTLHSRSLYGGEEVDVLATVNRPEGLFYIVFIAPEAGFEKVQPVFEDVLRSVRFR